MKHHAIIQKVKLRPLLGMNVTARAHTHGEVFFCSRTIAGDNRRVKTHNTCGGAANTEVAGIVKIKCHGTRRHHTGIHNQ